jgi:hypothetical protein
MKFRAFRAVRFAAVSLALASSAAARAAGPTLPAKPTPVSAFTPVRIRTGALAATGRGTLEPPFAMKVSTQPLAAVGLGGVEPPFRPLLVKTDALTAVGRGAKPGGPK